MRTREQIQSEVLDLVRRLQTRHLLWLLEDRERYIQWLLSSRCYPDKLIEIQVNKEFVAVIKGELFIRFGSQ